MGAQRTGRWALRLPAGYSLLLTLLITAPLLSPGYLLLRDAVSTPRSYLTDTALGLGDAAPRAVPQDALLAAASQLVDGGILVKAILCAALWAAGYGAAVLVRELLRAPLAAQLVATTLAVWNPYIAERLLQGHWSLLTGYAALPWVALAALRVREQASITRPSPQPGQPESTGPAAFAQTSGERSESGEHPPTGQGSGRTGHSCSTGRGSDPDEDTRSSAKGPPSRIGKWVTLTGCLAAAGLTPTGALLAGIVAVTIVGRRRCAGVLALAALTCMPWLMATAVSGVAAEPSDPEGIAAFAARAEPGLGTLGSLAGLGGIWNADAVPVSRSTPLAALATVLLLIVVAVGVRKVIAADGDPERTRARRILLALAAAAVVLPALAAIPPGTAVMEWLIVHIPGAGLLRDTQKFVALAVPGYALCAAAACSVRFGKRTTVPTAATGDASGGTAGARTVRLPAPAERSGSAPNDSPEAGPPPPARTSPATALFVIGLLILPLLDLGWGVGGQMRAIRYPDSWSEVAALIDGPGDIAVLPGGMFRRFPYSGSAPVLDPAPRMLPRNVLQTGELPVHGRKVAGEGARARDVENLLAAGGDASELARLGVGWVLVERNTPGPLGDSATTLAQLSPVYSAEEVTLYRVADVEPRPTPRYRSLVIAAHILWLSLLVSPLLTLIFGRLSRRIPR